MVKELIANADKKANDLDKIHLLFSIYCLPTYHVLDTVLGTRDTVLERNKISFLKELTL